MFKSDTKDAPFGSIEYCLLTDDKIQQALDIQQRSMETENVAIGVGLYEENGAPETMKIIFEQVIKDKCTIVAVDTKIDKVVAVAFNKIHTNLIDNNVDPLSDIVKNYIKQRSCLALIEFLDEVESHVDLFKKYNTQTIMEIFYVGTDPNYRGFRIGQGVVEASLKFAKNMAINDNDKFYKYIPDVAFGVFTSNYSQKIAKNLNFDFIYDVNYGDFEYWGKTMAERIGNEHKTAKLAAINLKI